MLFIVEVITVVVRPVRLAVRLCINMIIGHVFIGLLMNELVTSVIIRGFPSIGLLLRGVIMLIMEVAVGVLQAYVFCLLLAMYIDEHSGLQDVWL